jgi:mannosyltransferase OCH1-like enzyme
MSLIKNNMTQIIIKTNKQELLQYKNKFKQMIKLQKYIGIPYPMKKNYNPIIPLNIFQTWHTKILPPLMAQSISIIKKLNPRFNYYLFDDNDCREFIKNNFDLKVLHAFDSLIPGAYKADLWRYCILYKKGGIYLDIKYRPYNGFRFINLMEKEHFVLDADGDGIYNALMVCLPGNQVLLKVINQIVENVKNKFYGNNCLEPTGPHLLSRYINKTEKNKLDMKHEFYFSMENRVIYFNNYLILKSYNGYLDDHRKYKKISHYSELWNKRKVYK